MTIEQLNELSKKAHETAVEQGFYDVLPTTEQSILLILSECSEALEADRKGRYVNIELFSRHLKTISFKDSFEHDIKDTFEDELADICIRLLDYVGFKGYEIRKPKTPICFRNKFSFLFGVSEIIINIMHDATNLHGALYSIIDYCMNNNINIAKHIELKMKYNKLREYKNGKAY